MHNDYIPYNDQEFLTWLLNLLGYIPSLGLDHLGIPVAEYNDLKGKANKFQDAFLVAAEPVSRTKVTVQEKNETRRAAEKTVRQFAKQHLTYSDLLTDADRNGLGLPIHKRSRTKAPVADDSPGFDLNTSTPGRIGLRFFERGNNHKSAKPAGQVLVETRWTISEQPIVAWEDLIHSEISVDLLLTLEFVGSSRGRKVYVAARWVNTRGKKGPWSEIRNAIIP
jgi:hypothetical protein